MSSKTLPANGIGVWSSLLFIGLIFLGLSFRSFDLYWPGVLFLTVWAITQQQHQFIQIPPSIRYCLIIVVAYALLICIAGLFGWIDYFDPLKFLYECSFLFCIPLALALRATRAHLHWILLLPALAITFRMLVKMDYENLYQALYSGGVNGFGRHHITFGLYSGFALLCTLAAFGFREQISPGVKRRLFCGLIVVFSLMMLQGLLSSGSRSNWLAMLCALPVLFVTTGGIKQLKLRLTKQYVLYSIIALIILVVVLYFNFAPVASRITVELQQGIAYLIDPASIPKDKDVFVGTRMLLFQRGWQDFLNQPWFGYGPGAIVPLLKTDTFLFLHPTYHNRAIDLLVVMGAVGSAVFLLLPCALIVLRQRKFRLTNQRTPLFYIVAPLAVYVVVQGFFWSRPHHFGNALILQYLLAFALYELIETETKA